MFILYFVAKAFIYPSIFERFGLPVLEAMACGTAVITSNNFFPEIAGDSGMLISPLDRFDLVEAMRSTVLQSERVALISPKAKFFPWYKTGLGTRSVLRRRARK